MAVYLEDLGMVEYEKNDADDVPELQVVPSDDTGDTDADMEQRQISSESSQEGCQMEINARSQHR